MLGRLLSRLAKAPVVGKLKGISKKLRSWLIEKMFLEIFLIIFYHVSGLSNSAIVIVCRVQFH